MAKSHSPHLLFEVSVTAHARLTHTMTASQQALASLYHTLSHTPHIPSHQHLHILRNIILKFQGVANEVGYYTPDVLLLLERMNADIRMLSVRRFSKWSRQSGVAARTPSSATSVMRANGGVFGSGGGGGSGNAPQRRRNDSESKRTVSDASKAQKENLARDAALKAMQQRNSMTPTTPFATSNALPMLQEHLLTESSSDSSSSQQQHHSEHSLTQRMPELLHNSPSLQGSRRRLQHRLYNLRNPPGTVTNSKRNLIRDWMQRNEGKPTSLQKLKELEEAVQLNGKQVQDIMQEIQDENSRVNALSVGALYSWIHDENAGQLPQTEIEKSILMRRLGWSREQLQTQLRKLT